MKRSVIGGLGGMVLAFSAGCSDGSSVEADIVAADSEAYSTIGIQRVIPIRVLRLRKCGTGATSASCYQSSSYADALRTVEAANEAFRSTGTQFWIRSYENIEAPVLWEKYVDADWGTVRNDLRAIYPEIPADGWPTSFKPTAPAGKDPHPWLKIAVDLYAKPEEITITIQGNTTSGCSGQFPWWGRRISCGPTGMSAGSPYLFTHEVGHFLGLLHPWQIGNQSETYYDLFYAPGSGSVTNQPINNKFFASKAEIQAFKASYPNAELRRMIEHDDGRNYHQYDDRGRISVDLQGKGARANTTTTYVSGDDALKGLAFPLSIPGYDYGINSMLYFDDDLHAPRRFSQSQTELLWSYLTDYSSIGNSIERLKDDEYPAGYPDGVGSQQSFRSRLGIMDRRALADKIDFDKDGLRDLALWIPPDTATGKGHFSIRLSSRNWSAPTLEIDFGGRGDTPVLADYDGDGKTDVAVYQPGGGLNRDQPEDTKGYWRWCKSSSYSSLDTMTCTASSALKTIDFGLRDSIPLPGLDFDGNPATPELAVYRRDPSTNRGRYSFRSVASGTYTDVTLGGSSATPLPGLYDDDEKTDLVVYNRATAAFELKLSSQSYATTTVRQFPSAYIPRAGSAATDGPGAFALFGVTSLRNGKPRQSLSVFFPYDGSWSTLWNPVSSSTIRTCGWGSLNETPLPGVDVNGDGRSDLAVVQPDNGSGNGTLWMKAVTSSTSCSGTTSSVTEHFFYGMERGPSTVADMTGDGIPEIVVVEPGEAILTFYYSNDGYHTRKTRNSGDLRGMWL